MHKTIIRAGLGVLALTGTALLLSTAPGLAEGAATPPPAPPAAAPPPNFNKGDNAWMLTSTVLVLLMTIPGLALFYAGLVRPKNALSVLTHVFYTVCVVILIWVIVGYSLTFTGGTSIIGGFDKVFLKGITPDTPAATFSVGVPIQELIYVCFQMTFAAITPALIVGAFAERMKFSAVVLFIPLWVIFVYFPIAHMVWYWAGPDAIAEAAKALAAATAATKEAATAKLTEAKNDAGLVYQWGAIDFAGGTVVHINAGIAGLVGALVIGSRIGYGKELMSPHSLVITMIGAIVAVGRMVRLQRRLQSGSNRRRSACHDQQLCRDRGGGAVVDVRRVADQGQGFAARRGVRLYRRTRRGDARGRLFRTDGRSRARPDCRRGLSVRLHHDQEHARL